MGAVNYSPMAGREKLFQIQDNLDTRERSRLMENEVGRDLVLKMLQDLNNPGDKSCGGLHGELGLEINNSEKINFM